ncbi:hypothetical protein LCGC14_0988770, partial [marine sediment metagenome]
LKEIKSQGGWVFQDDLNNLIKVLAKIDGGK